MKAVKFVFLASAALAVAGTSLDVQAQSARRSAAVAAAMPSAAAQRLELRKKSESAPNNLLFGTQETESGNFQPFEKWTGAVDKMKVEQANLQQFKIKFKKWLDELDELKGKDAAVQLSEVNKLMNQADYVLDQTNWGVSDYWASPGEFIAKFGDCEDYAIAKYMALKYLGWKAEDMRVVAVKDLNLRVGHAILAVYHDNRIDILDNQIKIVVDSRKIRHYEPVYSINEKAWWRHRARGAPTG